MAIVHWSDAYATGIAKIDEQHQALFKAVNDLSDSFRSGGAKEQIGKSIDFLVKYTVEHFRDEEGFMERYGYEGLSAHRSEHKLLLDQVGEFRDKYQKAPESVRPMEVARFLGDWLTHHISNVDMKYAAFLKGKGLK
jgi:hemerythrin-like metal-binding protein